MSLRKPSPWSGTSLSIFVVFFSVIFFSFASLLMILSASQSGHFAVRTVNGTDWPWHATQVESFFWDSIHNPDFSFQKEISVYPFLSYQLTALAARLTHSNPLATLQIMGGWVTVLACLAVALRFVLTLKSRPTSLFSGLVGLFLLAFFSWAGTGLTGLLGYNFYYPQLFSVCVALWCTLLFKPLTKWPWMLTAWIFFVGAVLLPLLHLSIAPWFFIYGALTLASHSSNLKIMLFRLVPLSLASGFAILINPSVRSMIVISANDGGIAMNPALKPGLLFTVMALMSFGLILISNARSKNRLQTIRESSGLIAICLVLTVQMAAWALLKQGSWYAVKKHTYILAIELIFYIIALLRDQRPILNLIPNSVKTGLLGISIAFLAQWPFLNYTFDQSRILDYRNRLIETKNFNLKSFEDLDQNKSRKYPEYSDLTASQNFYLATGVLGIPGDSPTILWFLDRFHREFVTPSGH